MDYLVNKLKNPPSHTPDEHEREGKLRGLITSISMQIRNNFSWLTSQQPRKKKQKVTHDFAQDNSSTPTRLSRSNVSIMSPPSLNRIHDHPALVVTQSQESLSPSCISSLTTSSGACNSNNFATTNFVSWRRMLLEEVLRVEVGQFIIIVIPSASDLDTQILKDRRKNFLTRVESVIMTCNPGIFSQSNHRKQLNGILDVNNGVSPLGKRKKGVLFQGCRELLPQPPKLPQSKLSNNFH